MLVCNLVMGIIGSLSPANGPPKSTETLIAMSCIWVVAYAMSAGPLGWAYVADTATPIYRAKTASFAAAGTCLFGLIFNYTTPIMISPQQANWGIKVSLKYGSGRVSHDLTPVLPGRIFLCCAQRHRSCRFLFYGSRGPCTAAR